MNFISLFSGAGGLDIGFERAGFKPIVAYDNKDAAVNTYNFNRKENIARKVDLSNSPIDVIIKEIKSKLGNEKLIGLVGGPPCQYFSMGNRSRKEADPRRLLPLKYAEILKIINEEFSLDFFIFENVFGLAKPAHKSDFDAILTMLENANFYVYHKILNAINFNVPQSRKRLFIIGWNKLKYPQGSYTFPIGNYSNLTLEDTISHLKEPSFFTRNANPTTFPEHPNHWTMNIRSNKFNNFPDPSIKNGSRSFRLLSWNKPSYTVAYGHNEIHIHPNGHRRLSIYEAMLIQGFPKKGYELIGQFSEQVSLISDSVPPPLAKALAESILDYINTFSKTNT